MKVAVFSTYDTSGGAALATYRMHRALCEGGVDSTMVVQRKFSQDQSVQGAKTEFQKVESLFRPHLDQLPLKIHRKKNAPLFSPGILPDRLNGYIETLSPDIVHLVWIAGGFIRPESVQRIQKPIVWTLHDMWPFTGGCHYNDECPRLIDSCGTCPLLGSSNNKDYSSKNWRRKWESYGQKNITVVSTSRWLGDVAKSSSIFKNKRIEIIPNNVDIKFYKPLDKAAARHAWNLPQHKKLLFFSAHNATSDKRKGFHLLIESLRQASSYPWAKDLELVVLGASKESNVVMDLGFKTHFVGHLHDEISQVLLYSAVDLTVAPSIQENLSNTVMESLACGTPVVAFDIGGMPDMIDHQKSGFLARPFEISDLASGIAWCLADEGRWRALSLEARNTVLNRYTPTHVANQYQKLYTELLSTASNCSI